MSRAALAALIAGVALAGCGGDGGDGGGERAEFLPGNSRAGAGGALNQVPEAECSEWREASQEQRMRAVEQIGATFERRARGGYKLPDDVAYDAIERACSQSFATAFKLWKIYEKALAFQYEAP